VRTRAALLLALLALLGCEETPAPPPSEPVMTVTHHTERVPDPDYDADNLLNIAYGASVISRTAELNLENSAAHAVDGISVSAWRSAPGSPRETLVFSLPTLAAVTHIGVTAPEHNEIPTGVRFESSPDGKTWREVKTVELKGAAGPQFTDVPRFEARYLRVHTIAPAGQSYARVRSIHAIGQELARPEPRHIEGCWTINGFPAHFQQTDARVTGVIETDPPTFIDGGFDGRVVMTMWMQGPMWGYAPITLAPDGGHLTGLKFHEEMDTHQVGEAWFGERCRSAAFQAAGTPASSRQDAGGPAAGPAAFLGRAERYSAFGLAFDAQDRLILSLSAPALDTIMAMRPKRIVVREHRDDTPAKNLAHAKARSDSLRATLQSRGIDVRAIEFVAAGSDWDGPPISSAIQRLMTSRVDIIPPP
jgi:hypothetical protein